MGGLRRGERRESRRTAATQRDRRAVFTRTAGAPLGQRGTDEISDAAEQDVRTEYHAFTEKTTRQQRQSLLGVYCPQWPQDGFASLDAARGWVRDFMRWYNNEHRHSRIRFVTPAERHRGLDHQVLARPHELYERAKEKKPERWSGRTRNWEPIGTVLLNPDQEQQIEKRAA
ncbi:Mobile element protein [Pseudomonas syringae pv. primulae]|uniref:Mobile element protein n=1 Tax=Pseudomonas syringae pv. primulae TaxID=251707 RepID=A0A3M4S1E5_9PSED|nr:Mobile element protein [Pseudomonas syringae pv. primulae]